VGPRAGLDAVANRKIMSFPGFETRFSGRQKRDDGKCPVYVTVYINRSFMICSLLLYKDSEIKQDGSAHGKREIHIELWSLNLMRGNY
jgi:hypothetical protein